MVRLNSANNVLNPRLLERILEATNRCKNLPFCPACGKENAAGATFCANCGKPLTAAAPPMQTSIGMPAAPLAGGYRHAEIIDRFVGILIDSIILGIISFILWIIIFAAFLAGGLGYFFFGTLFLPWLIGLLYFSYFEGTTGQTPGKSIARIKVVDARTMQNIDMGRAFIRSLLRIVDGFFFYIVGLILIATNPNRQRLGDMVANTIVIKI